MLPDSEFAALFRRFSGHRVGFVPLPGNLGDRLIEEGASQLFERFEVDCWRIDRRQLTPGLGASNLTCLAISGGGNFGNTYRDPWEIRALARGTGLPVVVLPQSVTDSGESVSGYEAIYCREHLSCARLDSALSGPDLALGYRPHWIPVRPAFRRGLFFRSDPEGLFSETTDHLGDPLTYCKALHEYLRLAELFEEIITDRLHFAIASLIAGRETYFLPNRYHKNQGMFETSLKDLGCHWLERPQLAPGSVAAHSERHSVAEMLLSTTAEDSAINYSMPAFHRA